MRSFIYLLFCVLLISSCKPWQEHRLTGKVTGEKNNIHAPLDSVRVVLYAIEKRGNFFSNKYATFTDANGQFEFTYKQLPDEGTYALTFERRGYRSVSYNFTPSEGTLTELETVIMYPAASPGDEAEPAIYADLEEDPNAGNKMFITLLVVIAVIGLLIFKRHWFTAAKDRIRNKRKRSFAQLPPEEQNKIVSSVFCHVCKKKTGLNNPVETVTAGMRMLSGECPVCSTSLKHRLE